MVNNIKVKGLIGLCTRAGKVIFGTEACKEAIEKRKIKLLIIAEDTAKRTKDLFLKKGKEANIKMYEMFTIQELSKAIGKENKAVIGITDINFSKEIVKIINGGESIG